MRCRRCIGMDILLLPFLLGPFLAGLTAVPACSEEFAEQASKRRVVTVVSPNGGEHYLAGSTMTISWDAAPHVQGFRIFVNPDGRKWVDAGKAEGASRSITWQIPAIPKKFTKGRVKVVGLSGEEGILGSDTSDRYYSTDLLRISSAGNRTVYPGDWCRLTVEVGASSMGGTPVIYHSFRGGWREANTIVVDAVTFDWQVPLSVKKGRHGGVMVTLRDPSRRVVASEVSPDRLTIGGTAELNMSDDLYSIEGYAPTNEKMWNGRICEYFHYRTDVVVVWYNSTTGERGVGMAYYDREPFGSVWICLSRWKAYVNLRPGRNTVEVGLYFEGTKYLGRRTYYGGVGTTVSGTRAVSAEKVTEWAFDPVPEQISQMMLTELYFNERGERHILTADQGRITIWREAAAMAGESDSCSSVRSADITATPLLLAVDPSNAGHVIFVAHNQEMEDWVLVRHDGSNAETETVPAPVAGAKPCSLSMSSDEIIIVAFCNPYGSLSYVMKTRAGDSTGVIPAGDEATEASIVYHRGVLHLLYATRYGMLGHVRQDGETWTSSVIESSDASSPKLLIDRQGTLHGVYYAENGKILRYGVNRSGNWEFSEIEQVKVRLPTHGISVAIDPVGMAHILYLADSSVGAFKVAHQGTVP